jgi:signal transduction histidine kinase
VVTDPQGIVLAQGHEPTILGFSAVEDSLVGRAMNGQEIHTLGSRDIRGRSAVLVLAASPIWFRNRVIGTIESGMIISESHLSAIKGLSGAELVLLNEGVTKGSTIQGNIDQDILFLQSDIVESTRLNGRSFRFASFPLSDFSGKKVADLLIGIGVADVETVINNLSRTFTVLAVCGIVLAIILNWGFTTRIIKQLDDLSEGFANVGGGDFAVNIPTNRKDEFGNLMAAFNNMTAGLKEREEQTIETERMAVLNQMALKIVPRLTMPVETMGKEITELQKSVADNQVKSQDINKACHAISTEINILIKTAAEFAEFSRFPALNITIQKIDTLVGELSSYYDKEIQSGNLGVHIANPGLMVAMDKELIKRAINIVLENAFEAAGPSGHVELSVSGAKGYMLIEIVDSGPGFSDLAKKNLFAPFFTTKSDGSGLSLIMAKRIMAEHDGAIEIEDNFGGGTKVRLKLKIAGRV